MVSKLANVSWPKGTFVETVKEWQKQWFYITEPRGTNWAAAAEFNPGAPMRLSSWVEKSPNWCSPDELIALQTRIQSMVDKNVKLVNVIQVMLVRRILPCQKPKLPAMEVQSEEAPYPEEALRDYSQRCLEVALQGQRDTASHGFGPWA